MMEGQDKQAEIAFFDGFGETGGYDVITEAGYQRILAELLKHCRAGEDLKVLDLGCGTGSFTARLAGRFPNVAGVDLSPKCVAAAARRYPHIAFSAGDAESLPYPDRSFDIVTLFGVLHHFPRREDALKEPRRLLKDGGVLFTYDPNINNPFFWVRYSERSPLRSTGNITKNEILFAKRELGQVLANAGFRVRELKSIAGVTLDVRHRKYQGGVKVGVRIFNGVERLFDLPVLRDLFGSAIISISTRSDAKG